MSDNTAVNVIAGGVWGIMIALLQINCVLKDIREAVQKHAGIKERP